MSMGCMGWLHGYMRGRLHEPEEQLKDIETYTHAQGRPRKGQGSEEDKVKVHDTIGTAMNQERSTLRSL